MVWVDSINRCEGLNCGIGADGPNAVSRSPMERAPINAPIGSACSQLSGCWSSTSTAGSNSMRDTVERQDVVSVAHPDSVWETGIRQTPRRPRPSRINTHKHASLTFARRRGMVRQITEQGPSAVDRRVGLAPHVSGPDCAQRGRIRGDVDVLPALGLRPPLAREGRGFLRRYACVTSCAVASVGSCFIEGPECTTSRQAATRCPRAKIFIAPTTSA